MASAWGNSFSTAFGASFDISGAVVADLVQPPRGTAGFFFGPTRQFKPTPKQLRRSRILHGLEKEIVEQVAVRQAETIGLDKVQREQELAGELRLRGIALRTAHFEVLAKTYKAIIEHEIRMKMRRRVAHRKVMFMLFLAAVE